jgi:hypothetical protein
LPRFEPGSLGWTTNALANCAKPPLVLRNIHWHNLCHRAFV